MSESGSDCLKLTACGINPFISSEQSTSHRCILHEERSNAEQRQDLLGSLFGEQEVANSNPPAPAIYQYLHA